MCDCLQLEKRKGKLNPIVRSIRARFGLRPMPLNIIHDADGLPRLVLTEPTGSSIEVGSLRLLSFVIFEDRRNFNKL